jgi:diguanylate cyclase (GGDEF)-like protein
MSLPPLRVLVISDDRRLLRQMSRFLNTFGYRMQLAAGCEQGRIALENAPPHVMILDVGGGEQTVRSLWEQAAAAEPGRFVYTLVLLDAAGPSEVADLMAAGADDFLRKPVVYGELLVRLRAAARTIEQERRFRRQEGIDPLARMMNREAFEEAVGRHGRTAGEAACVVVDLDRLRRINRRYGYAAGSRTIQAAAAVLEDLWKDEPATASLGGGRFAVLLETASLAAAGAAAAEAREALAALEIDSNESTLRVTASAAAATGPAETLVRRAEETLRAAKQSGGDCVSCYGQFDDEVRQWEAEATAGRLFENTAARHVMSPVPLVLGHDETAARAEELLRRTRLDALPVVDARGRLIGVVSGESDFSNAEARLAEIVDAEAPAFDERTPFAELLDFFTRDAAPFAIITSRGCPTGVVTAERLAALGKPASEDSFEAGQPYAATSDYLLVVDRELSADTIGASTSST